MLHHRAVTMPPLVDDESFGQTFGMSKTVLDSKRGCDLLSSGFDSPLSHLRASPASSYPTVGVSSLLPDANELWDTLDGAGERERGGCPELPDACWLSTRRAWGPRAVRAGTGVSRPQVHHLLQGEPAPRSKHVSARFSACHGPFVAPPPWQSVPLCPRFVAPCRPRACSCGSAATRTSQRLSQMAFPLTRSNEHATGLSFQMHKKQWDQCMGSTVCSACPRRGGFQMRCRELHRWDAFLSRAKGRLYGSGSASMCFRLMIVSLDQANVWHH